MAKKNTFAGLFKDSFKDFVKNPNLILPSILLLAFLIIFSKGLVKASSSFQIAPSSILFIISFIVISLLATSFFFSSLIGMSKEAIKGKSKIKDLFSYSKKFWLKNFLIILLIYVLYRLINLALIYGINSAGQALNLQLSTAQIIFFILYFASIAGILIFLTFSSFYLVIFNSKIIESMKKSILFVKKNYVFTLSILIIFFALNQLLSMLIGNIVQGLLFDVINYVFIMPYLSIILTRFVITRA